MMQVSANITSILESLLKDYDKTERPSYPYGELRHYNEPGIYKIFNICVKVNPRR